MSWRLATLFAMLTACLVPVPPAGAQIVGNAARVNGAEITNLRLERYFDDYVKDKGRNITKMINPKVYKKLKREALEKLIEREALWQAARDKGIKVSDAELEAGLKKLESEFKNREAYLRKLEMGGFDEKSYAEYVRQDMVGHRLLEQEIPVPEVSDEEIAAYYKANPQYFSRPEKARARHILVRVERGADDKVKTEARSRAVSILEDVRKGEDFATHAERYSEDSAGRGKGGDLGEFRRGQMVKAFEDAVFALKPGEISDVVETEYGYHIIRLESHTPAGAVPIEDVKEKIRLAVAADKRNKAARKYVEDLRALAKVETFVALEP
jgi:peptidyl-prolyl cis-trans isomerase C